MIDLSRVNQMVQGFRDEQDGEAMKSRELVLMLLECSETPFSRNTFTPGHITATGLVLHPARDRFLLIFHNRLQRWLLPGGHVEPDDPTVAATARREVMEETGAVLSGHAGTMIGVDVHGIPAKRHEPYHLHHDLLFHFEAVSEKVGASEECREVLWCAPADYERYNVPLNVRRAFDRINL
jgi:8-oxo-dGTP pyrophosphatase MutT (NUDIX family)